VSAVRAPGASGAARVEIGPRSIDADAVVLAIGGLAGGGLAWSPTSSDGFAVSLDAPVVMAEGGARLHDSGSPRGPVFEPYAWTGQKAPCGFERVGIWADAEGRARDGEGRPLSWLYAAGDAVADAPRTMLEAIRSGIAAGTSATSGVRTAAGVAGEPTSSAS
jgi:glycerol-3-phosphate dehydrogenase subunit B